MNNVIISDSIKYIGVDDTTLDLFESQYIIPNGVSYNSYLILDEKIAVMDTVDARKTKEWFDNLDKELKEHVPDYLIVSHLEPDHSANIQLFTEKYKEAKLVLSAKAKAMLPQFFNIEGLDERCIVVKEGEELDLGNHHLKFIMAPMVHWPETMMTFDETEGILFSGDGFGCFGTLDGGFLDTGMNVDRYWGEMVRYYSNIVGKYGSPVQKALQKLGGLPISAICSTHGPVWTENIAKVIGIYDRLSRYDADEGVVIVYGSMYGNTEQMAEAIAAELSAQGIKNIVMHNVTKSHPSYIIADIFRYKGLIIGSPTYSNQLFPEVDALLSKILLREVKGRYLGYFGSFTWAGAAVKRLAEFAEKSKFELVGDPVEMKQAMRDITYTQCENLARAMADRLKKDR
mgnify:FL=1